MPLDPPQVPFAAQRGPFAGRLGYLDAPFQSTPAELVERLLDLAQVGAGDRLIDLGCGDGRIVIAASRRGAEALGIDIDPARIAEAEAAAQEARVAGRARFTRGTCSPSTCGRSASSPCSCCRTSTSGSRTS